MSTLTFKCSRHHLETTSPRTMQQKNNHSSNNNNKQKAAGQIKQQCYNTPQCYPLHIKKKKKNLKKKRPKEISKQSETETKKNSIGEFKSNTEVMVARLNTKTLTSWCDADGEIGWFFVLVGMMNVILLAANDQVAADRWHDVDVRPRRPWGPSRRLSMTHDLLGSCSDLPIEFGAIVATVQYSVQIWASTAFVLLGQNRPNSPPLTAKS